VRTAAGLLLAACAATSATPPAETPTIVSPPKRTEIRFALIGQPTDVNVWALFDDVGASYANYSFRWEYWPRLLTTSFPEGRLLPAAAAQTPAAVDAEFVGTVLLRRDLTWTDGTPFTAEDVAFTVNTSLGFRLGADWSNYYRAELLEGVEAVNPYTVRFHFRSAPAVGAWQYGALLGPVVQRAYWRERVEQVQKLLPEQALRSELVEAEGRRDALQLQVDELNARIQALHSGGGASRDSEILLRRTQGDLDAANNAVARIQDLVAEQTASAHEALYALDDTAEPTLGTWVPSSTVGGVWTNAANPAFPFIHPGFERASYRVFSDEDAAVRALVLNEVDAILAPTGISSEARAVLEADTEIVVRSSPSSRLRYLALNPDDAHFAAATFRHAIACLLEGQPPAGLAFPSAARPAKWTVELPDWDPAGDQICATGADSSPRQRAVELLKAAGYTWIREPDALAAGEGLTSPAGDVLPAFSLLAADRDGTRLEYAEFVQQSLAWAGIQVIVSPVSDETVRYAVFSSGEYDLAILGWGLSPFPSYLCDWFGEGGLFDGGSLELHRACGDLMVVSDLGAARDAVEEIEGILAEELPLIPAYRETILDAYRNLDYPEAGILNGVSGNYGAPSGAAASP